MLTKSVFGSAALAGQRILVTGGTSGIGRATCEALAGSGAAVVISGRNEVRLRAVHDSLPGAGHAAEAFALEDPEEIPGWLEQIAEKHGKLSGVAHCAGLHAVRPLRVVTAKEMRRVMEVNVDAALFLVKAFQAKSVSTRPGAVVLVASVAGLIGRSATSIYAASKGAVLALTRALAIELAASQIRVNCVAPGMVSSEMTERFLATLTKDQQETVRSEYPLGIGEPSDVASAIVYLLSPAARWVTGSMLVIDGGLTAQ